MMKILIMIAIMIIVTILYACFMAGATADDDAERLFQDYLKYKKRKEEDERWRK